MALDHIFTGFENASPLDWDVGEDGIIHIILDYDHERSSPNRAVLHWHFQLQGSPGDELVLMLKPFDNIWNGRHGSPIRNGANCCVSEDGRQWTVIKGEQTEENSLRLPVQLPESGRLYVARIEPYRLSDAERLLAEIGSQADVLIQDIGQTVEGRRLEIVQIGRAGAAHSLLLRGRAHPWETGGNWMLEGLIRRMLEVDDPSFCLYAMPIANKDGVAHGGSRFNLMGKDLNRDWGVPADSGLAPENVALEQWLGGLERLPDLAIDFHNDSSGKIHVSRPEGAYETYWAHMELLEKVMRDHTWFTEGSTGSSFKNAGTFGEGLLMRYGIDACIMELNCNWSAGLNKAPLAEDWILMGQQMYDAFCAYFEASRNNGVI